MSGRPRTRRRRRSGTRRRPRRRGRCRRSGRSGRRPCPGRRRPTTLVCSATTSTAAAAAASRLRRQPDRAAEHARLCRHDHARAATSTRSPPKTPPATSAPPRTRRGDRQRRHDGAERAERARRPGHRHHRQPQLDRLQRQRRRPPLQRPPRHSAGFTPSTAQPDRTTDRHQLRRHRSRHRQLLLQGHRRRRRRQHQRRLNEASATVADATPPSIPGTLTATASGSTINLGWGAATDNVAVSRYNLHRGTTSGFTPSTANRIAQPTGLSYADTNLAPGTYFYKLTAEDAAGNIGPV